MLRYLSGMVDEDVLGLAAEIKAELVGAGGTGRAGGARPRRSVPGVCPLSGDGRLVVCGFLGEDKRVRIPNSDKALPRVSAGDLLAAVEDAIGPEAGVMTWNFSGERYDYGPLRNQVAEHSLGLHPAPPLALLIPLVRDVVAWLEEGDKNVAVLHDLGGRRAAVVAACCLLRMRRLTRDRDGKGNAPGGAPQDDEALAAGDACEAAAVLEVLAKRMGQPGKALVPSQLRYIRYYARFERESSAGASGAGLRVLNLDKKLSFQRLIVNGIPDFVHSGDPGDKIDLAAVECRPFIKVVQGHDVIAGTLPQPTYRYDDLCFSLQPKAPFPTKVSSAADAVTAHDVPVELRGDVLVKCYHQDMAKGQAVPMFAVAFHTAFVNDGVLRLAAEDIDGARGNGRFPRNFFLDLIFQFDPEQETAEHVQEAGEDAAAGESGGGADDERAGGSGWADDKPPGETVDAEAARRAELAQPKFRKMISRKYKSGFSTSSKDSGAGLREPHYSLDDGEDAGAAGAKGLGAKSPSHGSVEMAGLLDGFEGLDEDLALELEQYAKDLENTSGKAGTHDELGSSFDEDDGEDFDIDAFASSLDLDA